MIANVLNGAGVGATGPLIAYWFAVRFGQGPAEIGPMLAAGFLMAAVASVATGWLSKYLRHRARGGGAAAGPLVLLIALPFAPTFGVAGAIYVLRAMGQQPGVRCCEGRRLMLHRTVLMPEVRQMIVVRHDWIQLTLKLLHGILAQPFVDFYGVAQYRAILGNGAPKQASDIFHRQMMIVFHGALELGCTQ
jgi:hypothetical protein